VASRHSFIKPEDDEMLIEAGRMLDMLVLEFNKLLPSLADSGTDGSSAQAIAHALGLLQARAAGGMNLVRTQLGLLLTVLDDSEADLGASVRARIAAVRATISQAMASDSLEAMERGFRQAAVAVQHLVTELNQSELPGSVRAALIDRLIAWESQNLLSQLPVRADGAAAEAASEITPAVLTAYLRDRFAQPGLEVTHVQPLAGGFGKQTTIFAAAGPGLTGEFVMRRDMAGDASLVNDCHKIADEFRVIRAAFERGFPAPDAVWLDTDHRLLPGGDFIVMRRAPGRVGGNVFGAQSKVPDDLADVLADRMAELHGMPALRELGDLTDSIRLELWDLPLSDCIHRYIANWYAYYLSEDHSPSPSVAALFGWLLDNVPQRTGTPSLLHGDIGFHNFLFHEGRMSALVDWEFAHIGDPAEDLGYVKVTVGQSLDWGRFMSRYYAAGGRPVDDRTVHYFQIWAFVRNAAAANIMSTRLACGRANDLKLSVLPYLHIPNFIRGAQALIARFDQKAGSLADA
jgi:aminoglycoside phosphotransferase (APT) family kinase protein